MTRRHSVACRVCHRGWIGTPDDTCPSVGRVVRRNDVIEKCSGAVVVTGSYMEVDLEDRH